MLLESILVYLALGAAAGFIAGLLGVGGGLLIVPALGAVFLWQGMSPDVVMHLALGTSLATIVVTSLSSVRAHHQLGAVDWALVRGLAPGLMLGAASGAVIAHHLDTHALVLIFGIFVLAVALYMLMGSPKSQGRANQPPTQGEMLAAGNTVGAVSALLGIGGGTMTVPYLNWRGVAIPQAVAVSAACGLPIALAGAASYVVAGWGSSQLPEMASGYVYWPAFVGIVSCSVLFAPLGARCAHALPVCVLQRVFALFLAVIAIFLLYFSLVTEHAANSFFVFLRN